MSVTAVTTMTSCSSRPGGTPAGPRPTALGQQPEDHERERRRRGYAQHGKDRGLGRSLGDQAASARSAGHEHHELGGAPRGDQPRGQQDGGPGRGHCPATPPRGRRSWSPRLAYARRRPCSRTAGPPRRSTWLRPRQRNWTNCSHRSAITGTSLSAPRSVPDRAALRTVTQRDPYVLEPACPGVLVDRGTRSALQVARPGRGRQSCGNGAA